MHVLSSYTTVVGLSKLFASRKYLFNKVLTAARLRIYCYLDARQLYDEIRRTELIYRYRLY